MMRESSENFTICSSTLHKFDKIPLEMKKVEGRGRKTSRFCNNPARVGIDRVVYGNYTYKGTKIFKEVG